MENNNHGEENRGFIYFMVSLELSLSKDYYVNMPLASHPLRGMKDVRSRNPFEDNYLNA